MDFKLYKYCLYYVYTWGDIYNNTDNWNSGIKRYLITLVFHIHALKTYFLNLNFYKNEEKVEFLLYAGSYNQFRALKPFMQELEQRGRSYRLLIKRFSGFRKFTNPNTNKLIQVNSFSDLHTLYLIHKHTLYILRQLKTPASRHLR